MIRLGPSIEAAIRRRAWREGLKIHIASYGGSGTSFFAGWLNREVCCVTPLWHRLLNHYAIPLDLGIPRLVLMADPPTAYASLIRRDIHLGICHHLHGGQYGQCLLDGMVAFFDHWTVARPLIFCKYEQIYQHLDDLGAALGVSFASFPRREERRTVLSGQPDKRLLELRARFEALPDFMHYAHKPLPLASGERPRALPQSPPREYAQESIRQAH